MSIIERSLSPKNTLSPKLNSLWFL